MYRINAQMVGVNATDHDAQLVVQLLQRRGHMTVEVGEPLPNQEKPFPDYHWRQCLREMARLKA
jgi:hypothetical protein